MQQYNISFILMFVSLNFGKLLHEYALQMSHGKFSG